MGKLSCNRCVPALTILSSVACAMRTNDNGQKLMRAAHATLGIGATGNPSTDPQSSGFTLLEVAMTLTLLGILLAIATLQLPPLLSQTALRDATRQMVANLQYVRMKAVSQNRRLRVTFRPVVEDYIVDKDEEGVWQRQLLASHSAEAVTDATIPLPRGVRIAAVNSGGDIIFLPRGAVDGGISITLGTANGTDTRRVVVNLAGRVRVE
jgi:prepilin-type N-terminal cleavage/methylation domain-containing protein